MYVAASLWHPVNYTLLNCNGEEDGMVRMKRVESALSSD
jgi:hypothetical protein